MIRIILGVGAAVVIMVAGLACIVILWLYVGAPLIAVIVGAVTA